MYIDIKEQRGQYWLENIMKDRFAVSMFGQKRLSREGGIEIVVKELCTRMARDGCQVTCYNRSGHHVSGAEYDNKIEYDGIRQKFVPTIERKGLAAVSSSFFAALYSAFGKYDVVHIHAEGPAFFSWLPKMFGKRVVVTIHGIDWQREKWKSGFGSKFIRQGEKNAVKYADEIIVLSKGVQDYFRDTYGRETHFIPNGVNRPKTREEDKILLSILEEEHAMLHILDFKNPEVLRRNSDLDQKLYAVLNKAERSLAKIDEKEQLLVRALLFNLYRWGKYLFGWNTIFNMERHLEYIRKNGKEEMVITFENFIYECSHEPEEAEERYINSWKKNPCFELWKEILQFYKRNSMLDKADAMFETLFTEHTEYVESEPEYAFRAYISYILDYRRDLKKALHFYMIHKDEMKDEIVRELWESELMMCTNSFNNPDEFVEMRSVLVEQGLMSENEFHRISLVAYMCNLDSENAWKYFSKENPLFGKFDKAENEGVFLTNEGARFLVWQKKYPPHMEREWRGINIQGANAAKSLFEQEEWHLSPKSIANKLQYEIHKSIAIDTWGLYLLAVEEKLDLLERFDQIYVTHFSVSRMLEEITHFKNENMEVILAYLESAEHVKLQSPNFEVQLKVRENVNYYEPCSTIAMAVEAEIPAIIGETMLAQNLIDRFKNYIVRPDELEEMMGIACNSCFVREYQNNKG